MPGVLQLRRGGPCPLSLFALLLLTWTQRCVVVPLKPLAFVTVTCQTLTLGDDGDDGGGVFFCSEMCCELFSDPSQQEVVRPLSAEVLTSRQPCCHPANLIPPCVRFSSPPTHQSRGPDHCSMFFFRPFGAFYLLVMCCSSHYVVLDLLRNPSGFLVLLLLTPCSASSTHSLTTPQPLQDHPIITQ